MIMINICYITDSNYLEYTKLSIDSILRSKNRKSNIMFHIILDNVTGSNCIEVLKIKDLIESNICQCKFYENVSFKDMVDENLLNSIQYDRHVSRSALLKFLIPEVLNKLDKVIYIDGDTLILKDLFDLWNIDLDKQDKSIAAVKDFGLLSIWRNEHNPFIHNNTYFQSGQMLMNLEKLRDIKFAQRAIKCKLSKYLGGGFMDQDVFNDILNGDVVYLPPKYSVSLHKMVQGNKHYTDISKYNKIFGTKYGNIFALILDAVIIHFHGNKKEMLENKVIKGFYNQLLNRIN